MRQISASFLKILFGLILQSKTTFFAPTENRNQKKTKKRSFQISKFHVILFVIWLT